MIAAQITTRSGLLTHAELGHHATVAGFYSYGAYGEMGPFSGSQACQLHKQTMPILSLHERG